MEDKLILKELTYDIRGILFEVHNELGRFRNEKQYGDLFAFKLDERKFIYEREKVLAQSFPGEKAGRNRMDFFIADILPVELKHVPVLSRDDYFQCQRYLQALDLDLALLVNFRPKYLVVRRILNHEKFNDTTSR